MIQCRQQMTIPKHKGKHHKPTNSAVYHGFWWWFSKFWAQQQTEQNTLTPILGQKEWL